MTTINNQRVMGACCDIYQDEEKVILRMEMPGITRDQLSINVEDDRLIIEGEKPRNLPENGKYLMREIREGKYHQIFTLDNSIDRDKIEAELKNGLLELTLPLKEAEKPRTISVR